MISSDIVLKDYQVFQITVASVSNLPDRLQIFLGQIPEVQEQCISGIVLSIGLYPVLT
jgi:hypothetical protein